MTVIMITTIVVFNDPCLSSKHHFPQESNYTSRPFIDEETEVETS